MDLLQLPLLTADHRVPYGSLPPQFGDLWLPDNAGHHPLPVVAFFHGGWWKSEYDLRYAGYLCQALKREGIAVWSMEYRRLGATGGGWPETFQDASAGFEFLSTLASRYPLDLSRVITVGHSAGGHLAFWMAGRAHVPAGSSLLPAAPKLAPTGTIALAGAVDLRAALALSATPGFAHVQERVTHFMGGTPIALPERYREGDPGELLPFSIRQVLIQGSADDQIPPELPHQWARTSRSLGDTVDVRIIPAANHFDVVDPRSHAWPVVVDEVKTLVARR